MLKEKNHWIIIFNNSLSEWEDESESMETCLRFSCFKIKKIKDEISSQYIISSKVFSVFKRYYCPLFVLLKYSSVLLSRLTNFEMQLTRFLTKKQNKITIFWLRYFEAPNTLHLCKYALYNYYLYTEIFWMNLL